MFRKFSNSFIENKLFDGKLNNKKLSNIQTYVFKFDKLRLINFILNCIICLKIETHPISQHTIVTQGDGWRSVPYPLLPLRLWFWGKGCVTTFKQITQFKTKLFCISNDFSPMCRKFYNLSNQLSIFTYVSLSNRELIIVQFPIK